MDTIGTSTVIDFTVRRGRNHELDRMEAGTAIIRLRNQDDAFDPANTGSVWWPDIRPMTPVQIQATWSAVTYDVFNGFAEGWPMTWTQGPQGDAVTTVTAVDATKVLALAHVSSVRGVEKTDARIGAVLDEVGWTDRDLEAGAVNIQATTLNGTGIGEIQTATDSEGGVFFIAADGTATFQAQTHIELLDETNDVWGEVATEKNYAEVIISYDDANIWNEITVTAPSLADQTATDEASRSYYHPRSLNVGTELTSTADMLARAEALIQRYANPKVRIVSMRLDARLDDTQWPRIFTHELHSRVLVRKRPPNGPIIDQPSLIEGITHAVSAGKWFVTWNLSATSYTVGTWELGTVTKSELGNTTILVGG